MVAILPKGHPLLQLSVISPNDFGGETFVSLGTNYQSRINIDAVFSANNVSRRLQIEAQLSMAVGNMVASGAGVSIIDHITAYSLRDQGLIETRPFLPEITYSYRVLLPAHKPLSRLGETFLEIVHENLGIVEN